MEWTRFRRILRRSVQMWPFIINMRCRHSIECTISGDFLLDHILLGQIELEMGVRLFKRFVSALVDTASKHLDKTTLTQMTLAQLMWKAVTVRSTQVTLSGKTPMELAMDRRPRDLMDDPVSMNPNKLTSTPTKQDLLKEEIQKLALRTHLEVQTTRRHSTRYC